jgi:protein mago nashi
MIMSLALNIGCCTVWVGPLVVKELKRIVEASEITKYVPSTCPAILPFDNISREDDTNWPKKNIVGKQELEIRIGNDHIAFEVRICDHCLLQRSY